MLYLFSRSWRQPLCRRSYNKTWPSMRSLSYITERLMQRDINFWTIRAILCARFSHACTGGRGACGCSCVAPWILLRPSILQLVKWSLLEAWKHPCVTLSLKYPPSPSATPVIFHQWAVSLPFCLFASQRFSFTLSADKIFHRHALKC